MRHAIEMRIKTINRTPQTAKVHGSFAEAVASRIKTVSSFPGKQTLDSSAAAALVARYDQTLIRCSLVSCGRVIYVSCLGERDLWTIRSWLTQKTRLLFRADCSFATTRGYCCRTTHTRLLKWFVEIDLSLFKVPYYSIVLICFLFRILLLCRA
jgi:hypothetical protein